MRNLETRREARPIRPGFTLIELLVVLAIVAVLITLGAAAAYKVLGSQSTKITRDLISRLDSRLRQQSAKCQDEARLDTPGAQVLQLMAGGDMQRAKVIMAKLKLKQWFPTTFAEALNGPGAGYPAKPAYQAYLAQYGITGGTSPPQPHESAACLLMILQHGAETAGENDLGLTANTKIIGGVPCLVDAWGQPLVFCRWPVGDLATGGTGVSPVNPSGAQLNFNDPLDPAGLLTWDTPPTGWLTNSSSLFQSTCHPLPNRSGGQPVSLNLSMVIVSSGPDKQLGLDPVTLNTLTASQTNDNLYNR
jgi:prepilin-type N-terminal cleavage/methylation domain-containing protein